MRYPPIISLIEIFKMRSFLFCSFIYLGFIQLSLAQTSIAGVINQYTSVTNINFCESIITVTNPSNFEVGDQVIIIQMQGAVIDISNSANYGTITDWGSAGLFERAEILIINGNMITLNNWLVNSYDISEKVQMLSFPKFESAIVVDTLKALPWNGTSGGVLAFDVAENAYS